MATTERILVKDDSVFITDKRVVIRGKTYLIANLTGVDMVYKSPNRIAPIFFTFLGGFVSLLSGLTVILLIATGNEISTIFSTGIAIGCGLFLLGIVIYRYTKGKYFVKVTSSSGEKKILASHDRVYIENIVKAVDQLLIER